MPVQFWTFTGQCVDLLNPDPDTINITDIAWSLSHICRYNGHTNRFYSVAQHSVLVSQWLQEQPLPDITPLGRKMLYWFALMHDAAEAYIGDSVTLIKNNRGWMTTNLGNGAEFYKERDIETMIGARIEMACTPRWFADAYFGVPDEMVQEWIRRADMTLANDELIDLMGFERVRIGHGRIKSWKPRKAYRRFMAEYKKHVVRER